MEQIVDKEAQERVQGIVSQAQKLGVIEDSKYKQPKVRQSVLPGKKRESYAERKLREKKQDNIEKEIQELTDKILDVNEPVKNAMLYVEDAKVLTQKVTDLSQNEGVQKALSKLDELAKVGDQEALALSSRINVSIKAFQNDMENSIAMSSDLMAKVGVLSVMTEGKKKLDGPCLQAAAALDAQTSAANWSLVTMYGISSQELLSDLDEAVKFTKPAVEQDKEQATDVNVITDAVVKE